MTEGRTDVVMVKPEAMMMDGAVRPSSRYVSLSKLFLQLLAVLVGWMRWSR